MIHISLNIASEGTGVLNGFPIFWECLTHRDWIDAIRKAPIDWLDWAHHFNTSKSNLIFYIHISEDCNDDEGMCWHWDFVVKAKNIREFKPFIGMNRDQFETVLKEWKRDSKLNTLLID